MKSINTTPISGTQELLPARQAIFNKLKSEIAEVYRLGGYQEIETPSIERTEVLLAKAGGETEKQIYKVVKTAEDAEGADQALRFDHTVPLARYVIQHENDLVFPLKVAQIGLNFRGERAQRGRFREFYQCDIDVIGRGELPIAYDADVIATLLRAFGRFGLDTPVLARINNRKILSGMLAAFNLEDKSAEIYSIIDHAEKVPVERTREGLAEVGLAEDDAVMLMEFMEINGGRTEVMNKLRGMGVQNEMFVAGVEELDFVMRMLEGMGLSDEIVADMKIVRGLDYYTGTVFEFILSEYREIGSVCGGGRYENLTKYFAEQAFPGVGGSIGLTRLFYVLNEHNLLRSQEEELIDYAVVPVTEGEFEFAMRLADKIRKRGDSATVVLTNKKLGDKMSYAAKIARYGIVVGETEVATGEVKVKDFVTGEVRGL